VFTVTRENHDALLFDLDGVVTRSASVHARAWKQMFDHYLESRPETFEEFTRDDYRDYVDGMPRYDGVKSFLASRGIELPFGDPDDPPDKETVCGLGNRKNRYFHQILEEEGVDTYERAVEFLYRLRQRGFARAVVSSSKNCQAMLSAAGVEGLFDVRVDGVVSAELGLSGKPAPDSFLEAARRLGVEPGRAIVLEDAVAGVQAGKKGGFAAVIGVDRTGSEQTLRQNGADAVVQDMSQIRVETDKAAGYDLSPALDRMNEIGRMVRGLRPVVFLDYDGTLSPIVERPEDAVISEDMRQAVKRLSEQCFTAVISGRDLPDVKNRVGIEGLYYAGSHGFDISGPGAEGMAPEMEGCVLDSLDRAEEEIRAKTRDIDGAQVERKKYSVAVHYRRVDPGRAGEVEAAVDSVLNGLPGLRKGRGKKVFEIQPDVEWDKGRALMWFLDVLEMDSPEFLPIYLGDDVTDDDAFWALRDCGIGILVKGEGADERAWSARYVLEDIGQVKDFLAWLAQASRNRKRMK
ncbi:MAG: trehalose-phosphatase, partial [Deltaproteobacteria bacterium]|nr:trehalose-phosphatase [Deltaproteobacteria bacterium]